MGEKGKSEISRLATESTLYPQESLQLIKKKSSSLNIGIPKEISYYENRVSLNPESVSILVNNGHRITIETDAGIKSNYTDSAYAEAGAQVVYSVKEIFDCDIILKIEPPTTSELDLLKSGKTLISALQMGNQKAEFYKSLTKKSITGIAFELIQDKVGGMPAVRAMSEIAGNTSMIIAAEYLSSVSGGKGINLGGITGVPPTEVVILGAGTVAEYAARAAVGMGAQIKIFDNNIYKLRRIKSLIGEQVYTSTLDAHTLSEALKHADVVIGALRGEKGRSMIVVTEEMVSNMEPDSIIIDVSIDQGGCVETSEITSLKNPIFRKYDVIHYCVPNIASRVAKTATTAFSNIFTPMLLQAGRAGGMEDMIMTHKWFMKGVYTYKGSITNEYIANKYGLKYKDLSLILAARI